MRFLLIASLSWLLCPSCDSSSSAPPGNLDGPPVDASFDAPEMPSVTCTDQTTGMGFYQPPSPLPALSPTTQGAILKCERMGTMTSAQIGSQGSWQASSSAAPTFGFAHYRILYLSQGPIGTPAVVSATVYIPTGPGGTCSATAASPIAAVQHGTTGNADVCAPSLDPSIYVDYMAIPLVGRGMAVVATDYQGLGTPGSHPFLVGESEAYAVLDGVRALTGLRDAPIASGCLGSNVVMIGHSQGGHATLFAEQLTDSYGLGAGLTLRGAIAYAPAIGTKRVFEGVAIMPSSPTPPDTAFAMLLFYGWAKYYGTPALSDFLTPNAQTMLPMMLETECLTNLLSSIPNQFPTASALVTQSFIDAEAACANTPSSCATGFQPWDQELAANVAGNFHTTVPTLVVQGTSDAVVIPATTQCIIDRMQGMGDPVTLCVKPGTGHVELVTFSWSDTIGWLTTAAAGNTPTAPASCAGTLPACPG